MVSAQIHYMCSVYYCLVSDSLRTCVLGVTYVITCVLSTTTLIQTIYARARLATRLWSNL